MGAATGAVTIMPDAPFSPHLPPRPPSCYIGPALVRWEELGGNIELFACKSRNCEESWYVARDKVRPPGGK
jgi:hypothetical protein